MSTRVFASEWFAHVQQTYLINNENSLRNLVEEVMSYSITSRMLAVGAEPGRNRKSLEAVFARGEEAYAAWLKAVRSPGVFERTFWQEYQRARSE